MAAADCHVLLELGSSAPRVRAQPSEVRLFTKCRNERLRLPAFLAHYRKLGVTRFFVADNASNDGSAEYLQQQPDVHVFSTDGAFRAARGGTDWLNALLRRFGVGGWCLTVDVDELLRFPGSETVDIRALTEHLDARKSEAMACLLLDMYPGVPLGEARYAEGDDLLAAAPYFDEGPYKRYPFGQCPGFIIYGGVRERVFYPESWDEQLPRKLHVKLYHRVLLSVPVVRDFKPILSRRPVFPPCLTKVPLVRWDERSQYLNVNHFVSDKFVAAEMGALLHFKLLGDFHARALEELKRGQYYDGATEFRRYAKKLHEDPNMMFMSRCSTRLQDDEQLVRLGIMQDTPAWLDARARLAKAS